MSGYTQAEIDNLDVSSLEVIYNRDGYTAGPDYGQVIAYAGGFISGQRCQDNFGLGLVNRKWHDNLPAAKRRALKLTD